MVKLLRIFGWKIMTKDWSRKVKERDNPKEETEATMILCTNVNDADEK